MIKLPTINHGEAFQSIGSFIREIVKKNYATGCVIGLSGGIDSSVTAAIIQKAFQGTQYELVGYILPDEVNRQDIDDAILLCNNFNIKYKTIEIHHGVLQIGVDILNAGYTIGQYDLGNMTSRVRATYLNTLGAIENKVVAGTGNNDEDEAIGYYTLFGDGAVHCSPIGNLSKRLVYQMANYIKRTWLDFPQSIIDKTPSAGLEPGQTDEGDLGYNYDVVEFIKEGFKQDFTMTEVVKFLEQSSLSFNHKIFDSWYAVLVNYSRRNVIAKNKQKLISPPAAPVNLIYE